jgi:hypothetical protein
MGCAEAQTPSTLTISYTITGAIQDSATLSHAGDTTHLCSAASLPALHTTVNGEAVEVPPGPPVYIVDYDSQTPASQPGVFLKSFAFLRGQRMHSDPADDWVQLNAKGRLWAGSGSQSSWTDRFEFAADGLSGHVTAHGLTPRNADGSLAQGDGIDVDVTWTCPHA